MKRAEDVLRDIARSVVVGHSGRLRDLPRKEMIDLAREFCDLIGVSYAQKDLGIIRFDHPDSAPKTEFYRKKFRRAA